MTLIPHRIDTFAKHSRSNPLDALGQVLRSLDALRNGPALTTLLATFAGAGLLLAMAESSLAREALRWGQIEAGAALTVAFYGSNAAGLMLMDEARGLAPRDPLDALRDALLCAHRLLVAVAVLLEVERADVPVERHLALRADLGRQRVDRAAGIVARHPERGRAGLG